MHVKSILHEFGTCKIDFTYIRYYLAAKIDFTGFPILAAPDPGVAGNLVELLLLDKLLGDVRKLDADLLWSVKRGVWIEVFEVHGGKPGIT